MKRPLLITIALLGAALVAACGGEGNDGSQQSADVPNEEQLAVRVDDYTVTKELLQKYIESLPEQQRARFDTHQGRAHIAGRFIEDEVFYREAQKENLDELDYVKEQLEGAKRRILIGAFINERVSKRAEPTEQELHDYYESHQDVYTNLEVLRAQHIFSKSEEKLEEIKERIVEGGEKFTTLATEYSEDKLTAPDGGNLGYFNPGGYIRGIGYSEEFNEVISTMEVGKVYGPIKWDKGYSLVRLNERRPAEVKPYADVRDEIRRTMVNQRIEDAKVAMVDELLPQYEWRNYMNEYYETIQRSPEELFNLAQTSSDSRERLRTFQEILDKFPNSEYAPQALFMIGFVYAEELKDKVSADHTFNQLLERYPESEVAESARWMVNNMDSPLPEFENIDDLNKKLRDDSN